MKKRLFAVMMAVVCVLMLGVSAYALTYEYTIGELRLTNMYGHRDIDYTGGSCMVELTYKRNVYDTDGYIIVVSYSETGRLISFNYLYTTEQSGKIATLVTPLDGEDIGRIKAYVWDDLNSMSPLAEERSIVLDAATPDVPFAADSVKVDGTLVADIDGVTENFVRIKNSADSSSATVYRLSGDAEFYVNGALMGEVGYDVDLVHALMADSIGDTMLVRDTDRGGYYNRILINYYVTAEVESVSTNDESTKVVLGNVIYNDAMWNPGNTFTIYNRDLETGDITVHVTRNGEKATLADLQQGDIVSIQYDLCASLEASAFFNIIATDNTVSGQYTGYDDVLDEYEIDGVSYKAVTDLTANLELGADFVFRLDTFGRIYDYKENSDTETKDCNFAIVERYVDIEEQTSSSEYSYIQVMTLNGEESTLYIDSNYDDDARRILNGMGIESIVAQTAKNVPIENRIIEYKLNSAGQIKDLQFVTTEVFAGMEYNATTNKLCKRLSKDAAIINATDYDRYNARTSDYKTMKLSDLQECIEYDGILVYKNADAEYCYVIITDDGPAYHQNSDFSVVAENASTASQAVYGGEETYTLYVMQMGINTAEKLYISKTAKIYYNGTQHHYADDVRYLKQGAVFYYTADDNGIVEEINVVMQGGYGFDELLNVTDMTETVSLPDGSDEDMYNPENWGITLNEKEIRGDTAIQLLLAPVCRSGDNYVSVAPVGYDSETGCYYMDTENEYDYAVTDNTNIYAFDMSGDYAGRNAMSGGSFKGINTNNVDADGRAWFYYDDEYNYADTVQMAFMMVVNGTVTNALVTNQ